MVEVHRGILCAHPWHGSFDIFILKNHLTFRTTLLLSLT